MNVLITGITGFVGSHLCDYILENHPNATIYGLARWRSPLDNITHILDKVNLCYGDLTDLPSLRDTLRTCKPDYVFHLAAQSEVSYSFIAPIATLNTNCIGTANLLEALREFKDTVIHVCSSSEVYGQVTESEVPITEDCPLRPASPYAVSKVCEDMLAYQYYQSWGLKTIRTRMFTHTGPRRGWPFVVSNFAKQIVEIEESGKEGTVRVGNLSSIRTFADVRDTVRAYWLLMEKCTPGEVYNIGGNETMTIGEMLDKLVALSPANVSVEVDPSRLRPSDVTLQIPCCDKFKKITGWEPKITFEQTLKDMLDYWRLHG